MLWLVGSAAVACEGEGVQPVADATAGADEQTVTLLADIELTRHCDRVGAVEVQIRARRIGCERPTPCTIPAEPPEILGDRATCPSAEVRRWMGVQLDRSGRYLVDAVVRFATGDPVMECLTEGGEAQLLVTTDELDAGAERILDASAAPCPEA
jgi:hypothetical protein